MCQTISRVSWSFGPSSTQSLATFAPVPGSATPRELGLSHVTPLTSPVYSTARRAGTDSG